VYTFDEALQDPQLVHNQTFVEYDHPVAGRVRGVKVPGKFSETQPEIRHPAPGLGEHTIDILRECGFVPAQINALLENQAAIQEQQATTKAATSEGL
jgi:crotonobetainyl-CoA:carnitine CoA-transferase CaiB-like acyl-CoA transferase